MIYQSYGLDNRLPAVVAIQAARDLYHGRITDAALIGDNADLDRAEFVLRSAGMFHVERRVGAILVENAIWNDVVQGWIPKPLGWDDMMPDEQERVLHGV